MSKQPAIVVVAFYAVQWDLGILPKWLVISTFALALTLGVYLLVIRQVNGIRWLLGMKPRRRSPQKTGNEPNSSKRTEQEGRPAETLGSTAEHTGQVVPLPTRRGDPSVPSSG